MRLSNDQRDWLILTLVPGIGSVHFIRLLARYRTPTEVLKASESALAEIAGPKLAQRIAQYAQAADVEAQERLMEKFGATLITMNDTAYPARLAEIYDPPLVLFARGALLEDDEHCVAIVGTRNATPYGFRTAERLAGELAARGITVVSGMASGIDTAAHKGALEAGGRTIAVLGNGVDIVYPDHNRELMDRIIAQGCVLSQFPMGTKPSKGHFPYRNRIISGMTLGTVVVQAPIRSGALITAQQAMEQGREVFAVPGEVGVANSEGPHSLLREGAKLVETVEDILVELNLPASMRLRPSAAPIQVPMTPHRVPQPHPPVQSAAPALAQPATPQAPVRPGSDTERNVLSVLTQSGSFVDEIASACRISVSEALTSLTMLEIKGLVRQFSGKRFAPK